MNFQVEKEKKRNEEKDFDNASKVQPLHTQYKEEEESETN